MGLKVEDRGLKEEKLKLFDETTRFVSSYKEASIKELKDEKTLKEEDSTYQLSMLQFGTVKVYSFSTFEEAYKKYEVLLKNDDKGCFV